MRMLSLLWRCGVVACGIGASAACAAPVPHPTRKDRLVEERDGFRVEYSPGQEAYAEAVFAALKEFAVKEAQFAAAPTVVQPGSWADLLAHRDEILRQVAAEIGLAGPTERQERVFDAMLDYYEYLSREAEMRKAVEVWASRPNQVEIWDGDELTRRLRGGELIDGYRYDALKNMGEHSNTLVNGPLVDGDLQVGGMKLRQSPEVRSFSYSTRGDGVFDVTIDYQSNANGSSQTTVQCWADFGQLRPPKRFVRTNYWERAMVEGRLRYVEESRVSRTVFLNASNPGKTPGEIANELVSSAWSEFMEISARPDYVKAYLVHTILHEMLEVGIVDKYIDSADRRWLCEGTANFVAWKVLKDRYGAGFARQGYDLDALLAEYGALQSRVNLRRWSTSEVTTEAESDLLLMKARYVFATRAVLEMARQHGEAVVPKLFQEIAKTPRAKVRMATVEKAYRKITGKRLKDVIRTAETTPVPAVSEMVNPEPRPATIGKQ